LLGQALAAMQDANDAPGRGPTVVVASAGNEATGRPTYPAAYPGVIGVAAIGPAGPAPFSNFGPWVRACAPGVDLVSKFFTGFEGLPNIGPEDPDRFHGWARWSGTSFAAPVVAGALARQMQRGLSTTDAVAQVIDHPALARIPNFGTIVNVI
jgi:subtilisin family serine protease